MSKIISYTIVLLLLTLSAGELVASGVEKNQQGMMYRSFKALNIKKSLFRKLTTDPKRGKAVVTDRSFSREVSAETYQLEGYDIVTAIPPKEARQHLILFHGGAYVAQANKGHLNLMRDLVEKYGFTISFLDYPLAPEHCASETFEWLDKAYAYLKIKYPASDFCFLGDSAGGGMALALLQRLRDKGETNMPEKTVLLSPWLDASMTNDEIKDYIETDVVLDLDGLLKCAHQFACEKKLNDPMLSPIYGNLNHLNSIAVFVSNYEVFFPDCIELNKKVEKAQGTVMTLFVKDKQLHDWIVLPVKERNATLRELAAFILED